MFIYTYKYTYSSKGFVIIEGTFDKPVIIYFWSIDDLIVKKSYCLVKNIICFININMEIIKVYGRYVIIFNSTKNT